MKLDKQKRQNEKKNYCWEGEVAEKQIFISRKAQKIAQFLQFLFIFIKFRRVFSFTNGTEKHLGKCSWINYFLPGPE